MFETDLFTCIKMDLGLNNLRWLMCHKPNQTKPNLSPCIFISQYIYIYIERERERVREREIRREEGVRQRVRQRVRG